MPHAFEGGILVPFSPESSLSGVNRKLMPNQFLWYSRKAELPEDFNGKRILLHFGAVDCCAIVYINGKEITRHTGGYLPFSAEITDFVSSGSFELSVCVTDPSDSSYHSRGKQKTKRGGMVHTSKRNLANCMA